MGVHQSESTKHMVPRNQDTEEGFEYEEGCLNKKA